MMRRWLPVVLVSVLGAAAERGSLGLDGRGGWARRPLAMGMFGGFMPGSEPALLEFHGANCDHCEVS